MPRQGNLVGTDPMDQFLRGNGPGGRYIGVGNGVYDTENDRFIGPDDPDFKPEWAAVNAQRASIPEGYHATAFGEGDPSVNFGIRPITATERDTPPWYKDPALIGALALPAAAIAIPALAGAGAAEAGTGTAAATLPSTTIGSGMATLPGLASPGVASAAGTAGTIGAAGAAPLASTATAPAVGSTASGLAPSGAVAGSKAVDPLTMYMMFSTAASAVGKYEDAKAANNAAQLSAGQFEEQRTDSKNNAIANFLGQQQALRNTQANQGLMSTQLNPYKQAEDLNRLNVKRSFISGGQNPANIDLSAVSPDALKSAGDYFYRNAAAASPNVPLTGRSDNAEQFRQGYQAQNQTDQNKIMDYLSSNASTPQTNGPQMVRDAYQQITGGKYQPTAQDLTRFGMGIDQQQMAGVYQTLTDWWTRYQKDPNAQVFNTNPNGGAVPRNPAAPRG